jgi:7,8-dihydropterin-6-yl-methyl-4-(beta-D-ribofuranosyl)aminobenzene 5'-phosphate synthase
MASPLVKVTILVDNHAGKELHAEHGLSMWIEVDDKRILFDTGQGRAFEENTRTLGIDLQTTDFLVLSHGHFDHTGGLPYALQHAQNAVVNCHPAVLRSRFSVNNGIPKPVHIPEASARALQGLSTNRVRWVEDPCLLTADIGLTGLIPRVTSFEDTGGPFYLDPESTQPDSLEDDLALWIRTDKGAIVCVGCSHAGVVNTVRHVQRLTQDLRVRAILGGFHLVNADPDRLEQTIAEFRALKPDLIVPAHCTGDRAVEGLQKELGARVTAGEAGKTFCFNV